MTKELSEPQIIFEHQIKWSKKNWEDTLKQHTKKVEYIINKLNTLNIWSNLLHDIESNKNLLDEISLDAYMSLLFANQSLYKYSYVCLRSVLEMSLRLVYFSTHPTEYEWWMNGNEWFRSKKDVWGDGYVYFENLKMIKDYNKEIPKKEKFVDETILKNSFESFFKKNVKDILEKIFKEIIEKNPKIEIPNIVIPNIKIPKEEIPKEEIPRKDKYLLKKISGLYSKLSKYVHSNPKSFQSKPTRFLPKYELNEYIIWYNTFLEVMEYMNILFILCFLDKFKDFTSNEKEIIISIGIENQENKDIINKLIQ